MKNLRPFSFSMVALLASMTWMSCGDIEQQLHLNLNGSGSIETTFDVGEMMTMMDGLSQMAPADITVSEPAPAAEPAIDSTKKSDPFQSIIDKVTDTSYGRDFDTLISIVSIMPDSVKEKQTRMDLAQKIQVRMKSPANSGNMIIGLKIDFDNAAQLQEIAGYLDTLDSSGGQPMLGADQEGFPKSAFLPFDINAKEGWIRVDSVDYTDLNSGFMSSDEMMGSEDEGMMEMMFGNSKIRTIIHVPGEVESCTNKKAILTKDNRVIIEEDFLDVLKKGKTPAYTIRFTPK